MSAVLTPDIADLIGRPYSDEHGDCWAVARAVLCRFGYAMPVDPAACLACPEAFGRLIDPREVLRPADVLWMKGPRPGVPHIGVCIDAFMFLHATRSGLSRLDRIDHFERAGRIRMRLRLRPSLLGERP